MLVMQFQKDNKQDYIYNRKQKYKNNHIDFLIAKAC